MSKIISAALALLVILGIGGCKSVPGVPETETLPPEVTDNLSLEITYPPDGAAVDNNLIKLTGTISDPAASVVISYAKAQSRAIVAGDGGFYGWLDLLQGSSTIEVTASNRKSSLTKTLNVTFNPPLAVFLDDVGQAVTYNLKPIFIHFTVTRPEANVMLNRLLAEVIHGTQQGGQGYTEMRLTDKIIDSVPGKIGDLTLMDLGQPGNYAIEVVATLGVETDSAFSDIFEITPEGEFKLFTHPHPAPMIPDLTPNSISLKAGETKTTFFTMPIGKEIEAPTKFSYTISNVSSNGSDFKLLMPDGLDVLPTLGEFNIWPKTKYYPEILVKTTGDVIPGEYWFFVEYQRRCADFEKTWFSVTVTP